MAGDVTNIAASVHQRLLNKAKETGRPFNELLQYFAIERFLYRLSRSPHADRFILKGALMFAVWSKPTSRPTMDIDANRKTPITEDLTVFQPPFAENQEKEVQWRGFTAKAKLDNPPGTFREVATENHPFKNRQRALGRVHHYRLSAFRHLEIRLKSILLQMRKEVGIFAVVWAFLSLIPPIVPRCEATEENRQVFLVSLQVEASWHDLAFLATVPAAYHSGNGSPAVIACTPARGLSPEIADYLRRYKPDHVWIVGDDEKDGIWPVPRATRILCATADEAARALAGRFFKRADRVVICGEADFKHALVASSLAARIRVPLLFCSSAGLSQETCAQIDGLETASAILVGSCKAAEKQLKQRRIATARLDDAEAVLRWMSDQDMCVDYLAIVNPNDRLRGTIRKLSLAAPLLAAGRGGAVIPLDYETRWKHPFTAENETKAVRGTPASRKPYRTGTIAIDGLRIPFALGSGDKEHLHLLYIDANRNGRFKGASEGPFRTGDTIELNERRWSVSLDPSCGVGKADFRLTYPCAGEIRDRLHHFFSVLGSAPAFLCIVGMPDAIPFAIVAKSPVEAMDLPTDFVYANCDSDLFAEIGVGRIIAEDASSATLLATRSLTYEALLDPAWTSRVATAEWESAVARAFENVGFSAPWHHDSADGFAGPDSPLASVSAIVHGEHSGWYQLGKTFNWDSEVLLAPCVIDSSGCGTACLDRDPGMRSVVSRILRNGAVGFLGNFREGIAAQEQVRVEFWNGVLSGLPLGEAYRRALNSKVLLVLDRNQQDGGNEHYQLYNAAFYGDPALKLHIPRPSRVLPARVEAHGSSLRVHAPGEWWRYRIFVPSDWKRWHGKTLYTWRGSGTFPESRWFAGEYNLEDLWVAAEFRTSRRVAGIRQVRKVPSPLGWTGRFFIDEHDDKTRSVRWLVKLIDVDQVKGEIRKKLAYLDYRIRYK